MRKFLLFATTLALLFNLSNKAFAVCSGASSAGALNPTVNWQTQSVNTYTYYTFVATYPGETIIFSFCDGGGSNSVDTQIEIYNNAGTPIAGFYNDDHCGLGSEVVFVAPSAGTYRIGIYRYYCSSTSVAAGTLAFRRLPAPTSADCLGALPLCNANNTHTVSASGEGNYYDLYDFQAQQGMAVNVNNCPNCLVSGEDNNMWYTYTAQTSGTVTFTIIPVNSADDYDWAVFDLNGGVDCNDLVNYSTAANQPISCNYCGTTGNTGVSAGSTCNGPNGCSNFNATLNAVAGNTYVLNVSNFSASTNGYSVNFGGTASIIDNTGPTMDQIVYTPVCGQSSLTVQFTERLWCTSVQPSDFILTGPNGTYSIIDAWSAVCEAGAASTYSGTFYDDLWTLELGDYLNHDGNYTLTVVAGGVDDICSNFSPLNSLNFSITGITATIGGTNVACNGDNTGAINVTGIGGGTAPYSYTLNGGPLTAIAGTSFSLSNLLAGNYTIVISDNVGQCEYVETITINEPNVLGFNTNITHPTCAGGGNDGSVLVTGTGGMSPYDIQLGASTQNGVASYNFTNLSGGNYIINITDNVGCTATGNANLNTVEVPDATFTYNTNQCFTGHSYDFTHTGIPIVGETYAWTFTGANTPTSNLENPTGITWPGPGTYNVTLDISTATCTNTYSTNIVVYAMPNPTVTTGTDNCGLCDGTASTTIAYSSYAWSTGSTANNLTGLCAGGYDVTVTDVNSCTAIEPFTIVSSGTIPTATVTPTPPVCNGDCNGSAVVNAVGCATYSYNYSSGTTPNNQSTGGLCDGSYTVTVADGSNAACFTVENFTITEPAAMVLTMGSSDATCGMTNGQASVTVSGHTPPASYNWSNGGITGTITVAAGNYIVTVTDGAGCSAVNSVIVNDAGVPFTVSTSTNNDVTCFGDCDGSATVTATGAGPFTYLWDNGQTTPTATGLCVGAHTVSVTEAGCQVTDNINITEPSLLTVSTINIVDAHCGLSDGSITASPSGGTGTYTGYSWNTLPVQTGVTANAIPSGTYTVVVTDNNGCTAQASGFVGDIGAISVNVTGTDVLCAGGTSGTATATVTGGSPNYTYNWTDGFNETVAATTSSTSGLSAGAISVVVTDNFGCTATDNLTLTQPLTLNVVLNSTVPTTCFGDCDGEAIIDVTNGTAPYSYIWSSGSNPNNDHNLNLCGGSHSVQVTDNNACIANLNFNISEPADLLLNISTTPANCGMPTGTATASPVGGTPPHLWIWSAGGATASMTNTGLSSAGNPYSVTVTDNNGCSQTGSASIVDVPGPTAIISSYQDVGCNGDNDGWATVSASSGTPPYSFEWNTSPTQSNTTATNLGPGNYTVTVSDIVGCSTTTNIIINQPSSLSLSIIAPSIDCFGGTNGSAFANITGGTSPYTYLWNNLQITQTATNLNAGTYSVIVTDANGCNIIDNTTIVDGTPIIANASITPSNCTQSDGAIDLTISGGSPPFTFVWDNSLLTEDISNIPAGTYIVTVTDNKGCQIIQGYPISDINGPVASITSSSDISCNGICNGIATVGVTGGTGLFNYIWSDPGQTTPTATNLCAGSHSVTVSDLNTGCIATTGISLIEPAILDITEVITNIDCFGNCNGAIDVTAFGGSSPYSYNWAGSGVSTTAEDQSGLCNGNYSLIITDNNSCTYSRDYTLTEPSFITVPLTSSSTSCFGNCTGSAAAAPFGGTAPYTYLWVGTGQTTDIANALCEGNYTVQVTDDNGCTASNSITIDSPTLMSFADVTINDAQCNGSSNASVSITIIGGTPPYDYVWDNGQVISNPIGLLAGQHCVTVLDNNGCMIDTCILIGEPPVLNVTVNAVNELCNGSCDGTITALPSGGVGPYSYLWSNTEVTPTINNLCTGVYNITITDDSGCEAYSSTSINSPPILGVSIQNVTEPTCGNLDGSITVGATGGTSPYTYEWDPVSGSSSSLNNIESGSYTVTLTDFNSCSISQTFGLSDIAGPQITDIIVNNVNCFGETSGNAEVVFTSTTVNNNILWSDSQPTALAINLSEGNYTVTITDDNGCSAVGSTSIVEPVALNVSIANYSDATCSGFCNGTATAIVTGGTAPYTYSWSNGSGLIIASNLCPGNYILTVSDDNGCTATTTVDIAEPTALSVTGDVTHALCNAECDGMISIYPSGGSGNYLIDWPQIGENSTIIEGLCAAAYTGVVYDANDASCFITETFIVGEPPAITAIFDTENSTCGFDNGAANLDNIIGGTGSYTYNWNPGGLTGASQYNLASGTYSVTITDGNGCTVENSVTVDATNDLTLDFVQFIGVTCYGGNDGYAYIEVSGGNETEDYTYNWSPDVTDDETSNSLIAGVYNVEVVDADGCVVHAQFPISTPEEIIAYVSEPDTICIGQSLNISVNHSGGLPGQPVYDWNVIDDQQTITVNPVTTTTYTVTVYDSHGCSSEPESVEIFVFDPLDVIITTPPAICQGQVSTIVANVTGGNGNFIYDWGNGIITTANTLDISPFENTDYMVIVSDGCATPNDTAYVTAVVSDAPEVHMVRNPYTGCAPLSVVFDNNTENLTYTYYWEFGDEDSGINNFSDLKRPTHIFNETGQYTVLAIVKTPLGCVDSTNIVLQVHDGPVADFNAFPWSTGLFDPEIEFADMSLDAIAWEWDFGDGNQSGAQDPSHAFLDQGEFPVTLTVYSQEGCVDTITKNIEIIDDHRIYFPTAINLRSPGNDEFYPIGVGVDEENYQMTIYNRWGEMVFTTKDWYTHWQGRYSMDKGDYVPQGVYTYVVTLRDKYGKDYTYAGTVTVFK